MAKIIVGIIGLGYVGLPLAKLFATKYLVIGFDISQKRINELSNSIDSNSENEYDSLHELLISSLDKKKGLFLTRDIKELEICNYYIITVPTPIDYLKKPNFSPLIEASRNVGRLLKNNDIVIYESTVYPGATEEICVPILEESSKMAYNKSFYVGYSPERINPGDNERTVEKIIKITSGSTKDTARKVDDLYNSVILAGTYQAPTIKIAEAAKVIENTQRDVNIAFVNELARIFNVLEIDTFEVLKAANTKWNFLDFKPGLVGGHCIGVDPYYLAQKAQEHGYHPELVLASRRINENMSDYVVSEVIRLMIRKRIVVNKSTILILGITYKANSTDTRNTKVIDLHNKLISYDTSVSIYDPYASKLQVREEYGIEMLDKLGKKKYDAVILAVDHTRIMKLDISALVKKKGVLYDIKGVLKNNYDARL